ncbi:MAG: pilus assembly protein TadG-related protein [Acidimicrobiales bacterium]
MNTVRQTPFTRRSSGPPPAPQPPASDRNEAGYILPMSALIIIPLMIFAAFATDVGYWYVRADEAQRTADAASLAGTVWLPDEAKAVEVAHETAARNGYRSPEWVATHGGQANATITVNTVANRTGLQVDIDVKAESFFGAVVLDEIAIERQAIATQSDPVKMGNPTNGLGTGNLTVSELGQPSDGVWLSVTGWCYDHQNGDPFGVGFIGTAAAGGDPYAACTGPNGGDNPTYDEDAYTYVIDVPPGAGQVVVEVFEPGLCYDTDPTDAYNSANDWSDNGPQLRTRLYANDSTYLYHTDNLEAAPVRDITWSKSTCKYKLSAYSRWWPMHVIPSGTVGEGRWYLRTSTTPNATETGKNDFAIRARRLTETELCSSLTDPTCPQVYALEWLPVWRPPFDGSGAAAEFYLAEISEQYAGRDVTITMFDPGEGMDNVQFLDPFGNSVKFDQKLVNCAVGKMCSNPTQWPDTTPAANDQCSGDPCLEVTDARFQDQWIQVTTRLPADYSCSSDCWWKIRYTPEGTASVNDRTTWSVKVVGGPVHLVE